MSSPAVYQSYYTKSDSILNYMTGMLKLKPDDTVLEPCGGDGVFVDKILELYPEIRISIYELNPSAVNTLRVKYQQKRNITVKETDTLLDENIISKSIKYDKIIGNPPYGARNADDKKLQLNQIYSNLYKKESYTLFLYACVECLKEGGVMSFIIPDTFLSLHRHETIRKYLLLNTRITELTLFPSSFFPGINFGYANLCIITLTKSSDTAFNLENEVIIRTGFKKVGDLEQIHSGSRKIITQKSVYERESSNFMFNSSDTIIALINDETLKKVGDIADCVTGFYSGDDKKYLHPVNEELKNAKKYTCASANKIHKLTLTDKEQREGIDSEDCLVPIVKGGNTAYVKPDFWYMDWSTEAILAYRTSKKCRFQNSSYYFRNGIGIPMVRSSKMTGALIDGRLFDQSIVGVFPKDPIWLNYLLGFFNSKVCTSLINAINPSTNNSANYIKKIPFIVPSSETRKTVEKIVEDIVSALKNGDHDVDDYMTELDELFDRLYYNKEGASSSEDNISRDRSKQLNFGNLLYRYEENQFSDVCIAQDRRVEYLSD